MERGLWHIRGWRMRRNMDMYLVKRHPRSYNAFTRVVAPHPDPGLFRGVGYGNSHIPPFDAVPVLMVRNYIVVPFHFHIGFNRRRLETLAYARRAPQVPVLDGLSNRLV